MEQYATHVGEAGLSRLHGELLLQQARGDLVEVLSCLHHALAIAQCQQAKSLELCAAMSLARFGANRASRRKRTPCWHPSMAGSPKALTPPIFRKPGRCWRRWHKGSSLVEH